MTNPYCVLCGNRAKSVSYYSFPKDKEFRQKWLTFCGIDEQVLNTATKLCWNHFQKDDITCLARGTIVKRNVVPSIMRKNVYKRSDFKDANFNNRSAPIGNFEFVSVNENPTVLMEETCATVNHPSTPPSSESIQSFQIPVTPVHNLRYFGDIRMADLATPRTAKIALELAKRTIAKQRTKIKSLQQARSRMLRRLMTMKTLLKFFKKKSRMCEMTAKNLIQKSKV